MSNSSERPIVGFKTAHGSMYSYDASTSVVQRLKLSPSYADQGTLQPASIAYFVGDKGKNLLTKEFAYTRNFIFLGYTEPEDTKIRYFSDNAVAIPDGGKRVVVIMDQDTREVVKQAVVKASEPELGLSPIDTAYYNPEAGFDKETGLGHPFTHLGNRIVKIFRDNDEFISHRAAAMALFEQQQGRTIGQP